MAPPTVCRTHWLIWRHHTRKDWERFCGFHGQQKKTNESVLNKAGVKRKLLDTVKAKKLAYYGHTTRKQIMQGTVPGARRRGRPRTAWMDNIKTWTGLPEKSRSEWQRTEINGESTSMVWPTLGSRTAKELNTPVRCEGRPIAGQVAENEVESPST